MYTRCPTCLTCFRVTEHHLAIADGQVRCGQCQLIFNAPEHAIDDLPINQLSTPTKAISENAPTEEILVEITDSNDSEDIIEATSIKPELESPETESEIIPSDSDIELTETALEKEVEKESNENDSLNDEKFESNEESESNIKIDLTEDEKQIPLDISQLNTSQHDTSQLNTSHHVDETDELIETEIQTEQIDVSELVADTTSDIKEATQNNNDENLSAEPEQNNDSSTAETEEVFEEGTVYNGESFDIINPNDTENNEAEEENDNDIPLQLREDIKQLQQPVARRIHPIFSLFFILILVATSFLQLAYFRAFELTFAIPEATPFVEAFCKKVNCHYSGPVDTNKIQLLSRDVRIHPKEKKALLINAAIINKASFAQPYPNIKIRLSDISGNIIAERIFTAKTYLGQINKPFSLMKSKVPVHINFEVVDPGKDAVNFEFKFL